MKRARAPLRLVAILAISIPLLAAVPDVAFAQASLRADLSGDDFNVSSIQSAAPKWERPFGDLRVLAQVPQPGFPEGIAVRGNRAYVATPAILGNASAGPSTILSTTSGAASS